LAAAASDCAGVELLGASDATEAGVVAGADAASVAVDTGSEAAAAGLFTGSGSRTHSSSGSSFFFAAFLGLLCAVAFLGTGVVAGVAL
jgi:hypothetical protein